MRSYRDDPFAPSPAEGSLIDAVADALQRELIRQAETGERPDLLITHTGGWRVHISDVRASTIALLPLAEAAVEALLRRTAQVSAEHDDDGEPICSNPGGHEFECTGTQYGGDDERWGGEGRSLCVHCGADGDA